MEEQVGGQIMDEKKAPIQYILVRKDLPIPVQMVNVGHAAGEAIRVAPIDKRTIVRLLHVEDEKELEEYNSKLISKNYHVGLVEEPCEPYNGAKMALATEPLTERINGLTKMFYHLKSVRFE